jgi:imidazolonepropionase-like amidohydrolase
MKNTLLALLAAAVLAEPQTPPPGPAILLRAARVVDVDRGAIVPDAAILVRGDRIAAVGAASRISIPPDATTLDLGQATLAPGLIDAHVHLALRGTPEDNARATLLAGFTTVQDLGALAYANVALRDRIAAGGVEGPRVVASGPWLGISGGICDFNGIGVKGAEAFRARVREDAARGVDLIKVCVTGWLGDAVKSPAKYEIADEELSAAIDEARKVKKRIAVHALSTGGIAAALRDGADLIVHGGFTAAADVERMKTRRVFQLPTLFSLEGNASPADVESLRAHLRAAARNGLPLAFGTDAGVIAHGTNAKEFARLTAIGLSNAEAMRTATIHAARAVGLADRLGVLKEGMLADIIGVDGNPLESIDALERVTFVMKGGRVVRRATAAARF